MKKKAVAKRKTKRAKRRRNLTILGIVIVLALCVPIVRHVVHPSRYINSSTDSITVTIPYLVGNEADEKKITLTRGTKVQVREQGEYQSVVRYEGDEFTLNNKYLAKSLDDCVEVSYVYPRRLLNLQTDKAGKLSDTIVKKGEKVKVVSVDTDDLDTSTGTIRWYEVEKNGKKYWLSGLYAETNKKAAVKDYSNDVIYSTYWDEYYEEGYSKKAYINEIDYKPQKARNFENNKLKSNINSVHVSLQNLINNKDYYMSLKDDTGINSLTVELKGDGGTMFYESDVVKNYMDDPSDALNTAIISKDGLADLMKEFQDAGFYMIARIVTFKDSIYAKQNKKEAITDLDGNLTEINDEYWPSAYSRKTWMYNVDVAKEVAECNVNEIQFDYCRFPDGTASNMDELDMKNKYNESKAAAIQGFLIYAKDELEEYKVYVAADIFAWPVVAQDDQDIGQFFPAIANVVDVICPMPYTDLFSSGAMGIEDPSSEPKKTLYKFNEIVKKQMNTIGSSAKVRNWIQAYGDFTSEDIIDEIKGINKAGYEGYLVWYGNGDKDSLQEVQKGFIDSKK